MYCQGLDCVAWGEKNYFPPHLGELIPITVFFSLVKNINKMRQTIAIIVKTKSWFILVLCLVLSIFFSHFDSCRYNPQAYMTVCLGLRSRGSGISCITDPWQFTSEEESPFLEPARMQMFVHSLICFCSFSWFFYFSLNPWFNAVEFLLSWRARGPCIFRQKPWSPKMLWTPFRVERHILSVQSQATGWKSLTMAGRVWPWLEGSGHG